ncbi:MAG TPA: sugar ABC transporter ATP-binding protein [Bryobacteraceae bacterium]|nr:sugar ABC transporter ATP-binding protein [Bryobacteraceae bacterium]
MAEVPLLKATNVSKSYGAVQALQSVSFDLQPGEVHALVGENGAGKSTLIRIITGATQPDSGTLEIHGDVIAANSPVRSRSLGVAAIYQQPALLPDLTVAENISLALEPPGAWRRIDWRGRRGRTRRLLERAGSTLDPDKRAADLTMPEQQLVEIAKAIGSGAKILIMDEPTSALADREVERLFRIIAELRQGGAGIIYISHRLEELVRIADRVTVLRDGRAVDTRPMAGLDRGALIAMMIGRELSAVFPKREIRLGDTAFEGQHLGCQSSGVRDISFHLRAGEILGLAGLTGSGRTELAQILFGLTPADSGRITLRGKEAVISNPGDAIAHGIAYLPEDRRRHGVIPEMSVAANCTLASLDEFTHAGLLDFGQEQSRATGMAERLRVKTPSVQSPVSALSGGNQQKVALSRWLMVKPSVLILDEPTQGVDIGAKAEIHKLIGDLAEQGMAILMISSELPEILGMSDRVGVMRGGTLAGILDRGEATQERILSLALGTRQ